MATPTASRPDPPAGQVPFSRRVASAQWHEDVRRWIDDRLQVHDLELVGPIEQRRIRPWSTQLIVPTDAGRWWFKAGCRALSTEPALHALLAELLPEAVDPPVAIDPERGWLITADHGPTLQDVREPTFDDWRQIVVETAQAQKALVEHRDRVLATGIPDAGPSTVLDRFDRLCSVLSMPSDLQRRLAAARPRLVDAVATLAASGWSATWQHGDLHPGNAYLTDERAARLFDFGDSQWAHPLEALMVPFGIVSASGLAWDPVLGAYLDVWGVAASDVADDWAAVALTHTVNRALTWWGCMAEATAAEWAEWDNAPVATLARMVDA